MLSAVLATAILSVCPSHAAIVSNRMNIWWFGIHCRIDSSFGNITFINIHNESRLAMVLNKKWVCLKSDFRPLRRCNPESVRNTAKVTISH